MDIERFTFICGLFMNLVPVLHIVTMIKNKTSDGQNIWATIILFLGFIVWYMYSLSIHNTMMMFTNAIGACVSFIYFCVVSYYRIIKCFQLLRS